MMLTRWPQLIGLTLSGQLKARGVSFLAPENRSMTSSGKQDQAFLAIAKKAFLPHLTCSTTVTVRENFLSIYS